VNVRKQLQISSVAVAMLCVAGTAAAQTQTPPPVNPPSQAGPQRGARGGQRNPAAQGPVTVIQAENQVQKQWNLLVLGESRQFLNLGEEQFPRFFLKMQDLQAIRDRHQVQHRRLIGELQKLTMPANNDPPPDDATVTAKVNELDALELQFGQQEQQALAAVDAVLTPFQRARFRVFEENMEKQKLRMLAVALRAAAPGPPKVPKF
jgi:Spy/CpxP family protein refolding chaperone